MSSTYTSIGTLNEESIHVKQKLRRTRSNMMYKVKDEIEKQ